MDKTAKKEIRKNKLKALEMREAEALASFKWLPFFKLILKTLLFAFLGFFRFFAVFIALCARHDDKEYRQRKQKEYEEQEQAWGISGYKPGFTPFRDNSW